MSRRLCRRDAAAESLALLRAGPREEVIREARAALAQARAGLEIARRRLSDTELTTSAAGIIHSRVREPGAVVAPGEPVATLAVERPVWVRAYVSEPNLGRIEPGMAAEIVTDSRPERPYRGQVGFISPKAEFTPKSVETPELRTSLVYRVRIVVPEPDTGLRQGMPVTVHLGDAGP